MESSAEKIFVQCPFSFLGFSHLNFVEPQFQDSGLRELSTENLIFSVSFLFWGFPTLIVWNLNSSALGLVDSAQKIFVQCLFSSLGFSHFNCVEPLVSVLWAQGTQPVWPVQVSAGWFSIPKWLLHTFSHFTRLKWRLEHPAPVFLWNKSSSPLREARGILFARVAEPLYQRVTNTGSLSSWVSCSCSSGITKLQEIPQAVPGLQFGHYSNESLQEHSKLLWLHFLLSAGKGGFPNFTKKGQDTAAGPGIQMSQPFPCPCPPFPSSCAPGKTWRCKERATPGSLLRKGLKILPRIRVFHSF